MVDGAGQAMSSKIRIKKKKFKNEAILTSMPNPYEKKRLVKTTAKKYEYYNFAHGMEYHLDRMLNKSHV